MIWSISSPTFGFFWVFIFPLILIVGIGVVWSVAGIVFTKKKITLDSLPLFD